MAVQASIPFVLRLVNAS